MGSERAPVADEARVDGTRPGAPRRGYVFDQRTRRVIVGYAVAAVVVAAAATTWVHGQRAYLMAWVLAPAPLSVPAVVVTAVVRQRSTAGLRPFWTWWLGGQVANAFVGAVMLAVLAVRPTSLEVLLPLFDVPTIFFVGALVTLARLTSGRRAVSVEVLDVMVASGAVGATGSVWLLGRVSAAHDGWYAIAFSIVAALVPGAAVVGIRAFARAPAGGRVALGLGLALAGIAIGNAVLQIGQHESGFTLPTAPLIAVQCAVYALLLLIATFAPDHDPLRDEGSAEHTPRRYSLALVIVLVTVPLLVGATLGRRDDERWVVPFALTVLGLLVALATVRELLSGREARRLFADVERLAAERRVLLADLLRAVEIDHHRTAIELHERALGALALVGSLTQASAAALPAAFSAGLHDSMGPLRTELAGQVDSLRRIVGALRPRTTERDPIGPAIEALAAGRFDNSRTKAIVAVPADLALDWTTETLVYRIVEEATANAARHAGASTVTVELSTHEDAVGVVVTDDGDGFDPALTRESGLATMRVLADLAGGFLEVDSWPGRGTVVRAVLGGTAPVPPQGTRLLHLVGSERTAPTDGGSGRDDTGMPTG